MTYQITGLDPLQFAPLFDLDEATLAGHQAMRVTADGPGFCCRVSLAEATAGEDVLLLHFTSHDVNTPYRSAYAIYVRKDAPEPARFVNALPPMFASRAFALRGFDAAGYLQIAELAPPGECEAIIRKLFQNPLITYIHAHFATYGCFAARIDRFEEQQ